MYFPETIFFISAPSTIYIYIPTHIARQNQQLIARRSNSSASSQLISAEDHIYSLSLSPPLSLSYGYGTKNEKTTKHTHTQHEPRTRVSPGIFRHIPVVSQCIGRSWAQSLAHWLRACVRCVLWCFGCFGFKCVFVDVFFSLFVLFFYSPWLANIYMYDTHAKSVCLSKVNRRVVAGGFGCSFLVWLMWLFILYKNIYSYYMVDLCRVSIFFSYELNPQFVPCVRLTAAKGEPHRRRRVESLWNRAKRMPINARRNTHTHTQSASHTVSMDVVVNCKYVYIYIYRSLYSKYKFFPTNEFKQT